MWPETGCVMFTSNFIHGRRKAPGPTLGIFPTSAAKRGEACYFPGVINRRHLATKLVFLLSLISLALSYTKPGGDFLGGALKPLAAILFIVAFIIALMKRFEVEQGRSMEQGGSTSTPEPVRNEQPSQHNRRANRLRPRHGFMQHQPGRERRHDGLEQQVDRGD
jgi:hypothetical protein